MNPDEASFKFWHDVAVRFKDIDVGGHAHHSHALVYFEEARAEYWARVRGEKSVDTIDYILAEVVVRYHERIFWPATLEVGVRASRVGRKHFELEYLIRSREGQRLVSGRSTQVMYDYANGRSIPISDALRAALQAL